MSDTFSLNISRSDKTETYLLPGIRLGDYEIVRKIGEGGMGIVYETNYFGLGEKVKRAIKTVPDVVSKDPYSLKRLQKEVIIASSLAHPNIVRVYGLEQYQDIYFITMEYIEGYDFREYLDKKGGKIGVDEAVKVLESVAKALDHAHGLEKPIIHRDLKPQNLIYDIHSKQLKIVDFGIASEITDSVITLTQTKLGTSGSPRYMCYEQFMGEDPAIHMDTYAFGIVIYEALSGEPPFVRGDLMAQHKEKAVPDIKHLSNSENRVIKIALSKKSGDRYEKLVDIINNLSPKGILIQKRIIESGNDKINSFIKNLTGKFNEDDFSKEKMSFYLENMSDLQIEAMNGNMLAHFHLAEYKKHCGDDSDAFKHYKESAVLGYEPAQLIVAKHLIKNNLNIDSELKWLKILADNGNDESNRILGDLYYNGSNGCPKDHKNAYKYYAVSAENNDPIAAYRLSKYYQDGEVITRDYRMYEYWLKKASELGYRDAQFELAVRLKVRDSEKDRKKAFSLFDNIAKQGHKEAKYELADCYETGCGCKQDLKRSFSIYETLSEDNYKDSILKVAEAYEKGSGVKANADKAIEYYLKCSDKDEAKTYLAHSLLAGKEINLNVYKKVKLTEYLLDTDKNTDIYKAYQYMAELGATEYQYKLADMYYKEKNDKAYKKALFWFEKASENGNYNNSVLRVGECYEKGLGTEINEKRAVENYLKLPDNEHAINYIAEKIIAGLKLDIKIDEKKKILLESLNNLKKPNKVKYYKKLAELGSWEYKFKLAELYTSGKEVKSNPRMALKLYEELANEVKDGKSIYKTAVCYEKGIGCEINNDKAIFYHKQVYDRYSQSRDFLLPFILEAKEVLGYLDELDLLKDAANAGNKEAAYELYLRLKRGEGKNIPKKIGSPDSYLKKAAELGNKKAVRRLNRKRRTFWLAMIILIFIIATAITAVMMDLKRVNEGLISLGDKAYKDQKYEEAFEYYEQVKGIANKKKIRSNHSTAKMERYLNTLIREGDEFRDNKNFAEARKKYEYVKKYYKNNRPNIQLKIDSLDIFEMDHYLKVGDKYLKDKEWEKAEAEYKKSYEIKNGHKETTHKLNELYYLKLIDEAENHKEKNHYLSANKSFINAKKYEPNNADLIKIISDNKAEGYRYYLNKGNKYADDGHLEKALDEYVKSKKLNPTGEEVIKAIDNINVRKERVKVMSDILNMVYVRGGGFIMGNNEGLVNDSPAHQVKVNDFYIGKHEVSNTDYIEFMKSNIISSLGYYRGIKLVDLSNEKSTIKSIYERYYFNKTPDIASEDCPVILVNWFAAALYCNWLSNKYDKTPVYTFDDNTVIANINNNGFRLPTEAEWEYAAKGGSKSKGYIFSGSDKLSDVGWYSKSAGRSSYMYGLKSGKVIYPSGRKKANELGIYDMSGNVAEWCWDGFDSYDKKPLDNPTGNKNEWVRVLRGGSSYSKEEACTNTARVLSVPDTCLNFAGFRIAANAGDNSNDDTMESQVEIIKLKDDIDTKKVVNKNEASEKTVKNRDIDLLTGIWKGEYITGGRNMYVILTISGTTDNLKVIYKFHPIYSTSSSHSGEFSMIGKYNSSTKMLDLNQYKWIDKPSGYKMVNLDLKFDKDKMELTGEIARSMSILKKISE